MTAHEARVKTLWNRLPDVIRREIEVEVKSQYTKNYHNEYIVNFYKSIYPDLFKRIADIVLILRDLNYKVQHYPVILDDGKTDEKLEIRF